MGDNTPISIYCKVNDIVEFILPLRITQRVYNSKLINSWDGSLTFNKNDGIILSTMMGAGYKDELNRFNGVFMGNVAPLGEEESDSLYYSGIGLYGYSENVKSFGFNINGMGFIGRPGRGQILFDGENGTIASANFINATIGMSIDVDDGIIWLKNGNSEIFMIPRIDLLDNITDFFRITASNNVSLIKISGDGTDYYLHSMNYKEGESGLEFDLKNGLLSAYGSFNLYASNELEDFIHISSDPSNYFQVFNKESGTYLIDINEQGCIMQSPKFGITDYYGDLSAQAYNNAYTSLDTADT